MRGVVSRIYQAVTGGQIIRQEIHPAGAGVALGAAGNDPLWSAWVDVALPALIVVRNLVVGFTLDTWSAACIAVVDIGCTLSLGVTYANAAAVTAGGALVIAGAHRAVARRELIAIAAGEGHVVYFPIPIEIPGGQGILARWQTVAGAETANISVHVVTGL